MDLLELKRQFELDQMLLKAVKEDCIDEWHIWTVEKQIKESRKAYQKALKQQKI